MERSLEILNTLRCDIHLHSDVISTLSFPWAGRSMLERIISHGLSHNIQSSVQKTRYGIIRFWYKMSRKKCKLVIIFRVILYVSVWKIEVILVNVKIITFMQICKCVYSIVYYYIFCNESSSTI